MTKPARGLGSGFANCFRAGILCIDLLLRRWYGIYEFSTTEDDLLRVSTSTAEGSLTLPDGTHVMPGDLVIDLHIWNERVTWLGSAGPSLAWASRARHRIERSLIALATHLESDQTLERCIALRARAVLMSRRRARILDRIAGRYGLTRPIIAQRVGLGRGMLAFGLAWAYNPASLVGKRLKPMRQEFWISRQAFRERYLAGAMPVQGHGMRLREGFDDQGAYPKPDGELLSDPGGETRHAFTKSPAFGRSPRSDRHPPRRCRHAG